MTQIPPSIPGTLKRLREAKGLTQQALADKLSKSRTAVAAWEYGRAMSARSRTAVAKILGCDPEVLGPAWNPHGSRPQYRRRQREEVAYLEKLRDLALPIGVPRSVGVDPQGDAGVTSGSPALTIGGDVLSNIPDADQFEKIIGFWRAMDPAKRTALVREAWALASPGVEAHPAERSGGRGKSQG